MLWQKELKRGTSLYVDYFADMRAELDELDAIYAQSSPIKKMNTLSDRLRQEGNLEFEARNWNNAILAYNYSLCFAENDTESQSSAYANRSAAYFELDRFDSCRIDIDLNSQVSTNCSDTLKQAISQHQKDCMDFIDNKMFNTLKKRKVNVPSLDFKPNESFPCLANVLQIEQTKGFRYRFTANCDIDVGKKVYVEKSLFSMPIDNLFLRCCVCLTKCDNLIPCTICTNHMFCSEQCKSSTVHKVECQLTTEIKGNGELAFLSRTVLYAVSLFSGVGTLMNFIENYVIAQTESPQQMTYERSQYLHFLKLKSDPEIVAGKKRDDLIYLAYKLIMSTTVGHMFQTKQQQRFLVHLIWQHEAIISFGYVHQYINENNRVDSFHLFPTHSQFNHSCYPNALFYLVGNSAVIQTIKPIKTGEEITISNFSRNSAYVTNENTVLRNIFDISCPCDLCKRRTSDESMKNDPHFEAIFGLKTISMDQIKQHAFAFLQKFGRSNCIKVDRVIERLSNVIWKQANLEGFVQLID